MVDWGRVAVIAAELATGAVLVGALFVLLWPVLKHRAIYPGGHLTEAMSHPSAHGLQHAEEVWLETEDGVRVHAWWSPARAAGGDEGADRDPGNESAGTGPGSRGAVLYCHGNAESMATRAWIAERLNRHDFDVLLFDYRGYGLSEGRASGEGLARDARAAWRHVIDKRGVPPDRVVLMGHSLGSAVATRLALEVEAGQVAIGSDDTGPAALAVGSPFPDMPTLFRHHAPWLPGFLLRWRKNRLAAGSRLGDVAVPVLVLIGTEDETIPPEISRAVYAAAVKQQGAAGRATDGDGGTSGGEAGAGEDAPGRPGSGDGAPGVRLVTVPAEHNTLMGHPETWAAIDRFLTEHGGR
ncbi:MAG: alpha/beta fold hydrolase [Longimicrobiales bacterium]